MSENTKRPFSRLRNAWKFFRLGLLTLVTRDEIMTHAVDSLANGDTDTTMPEVEVPTFDELPDMIKDGIDKRTKVIYLQEQLSEYERISQSLAVMRDDIEDNLLNLRIVELILKFSYNSDGFLDKILHEEEGRFVQFTMFKVKKKMEIFDKFIADLDLARNKNSTSD